jgi:hypothetical protein
LFADLFYYAFEPDIVGVPQLVVVRLVVSLGSRVMVAVSVPSTVVRPPDLAMVVVTVITDPRSAFDPCVPFDLMLIVRLLPS